MVPTARTVAMALVGVGVVAGYAMAGAVVFLALLAVWDAQPSPLPTAVGVLLFTLLLTLVSYRYGTAQLLATLGAAEVGRERAPTLHAVLDQLTAEMAVARPRLFAAEMDAPNALALGGARRGAIVLDTSVFSLLSQRELRALLAHELAHLERHDSFVQTLAVTFLRTAVSVVLVLLLPVTLVLTGLTRGAAWLSGRPTERPSDVASRMRTQLTVVVSLLLFVFTLLLRAHSRRRELAADDRAVAVTGDPLALASALRKLQRATSPRWGLFSTLSVAPADETELSQLLSTHPQMDDRIQRLLAKVDAPDDGWRRVEIE